MSRWTPAQLVSLRDRARDAVVALVETLPKGQVRGWDRLRLFGTVTGAGAALAVACLLWERAVAIAGAAPLRPLHRLWVDLLRGMNDPPLRAIADEEEPTS